MKISIITVCYNSAKTIQKTFESIRNQTYNSLEYIVVDGNSKDETVSLIKENLDIIDNWVSESDKGLYDAMNKGISMATGDVIGILNSDDFFYDNDVLLKVAQFHQNNEIEASIGNIVQFDNKGVAKRVYRSDNWFPEKLKIGFMPPHPSLFIKKSVYNKLAGYRLDFKIGADYELITRYFLKHNITWKYSGVTTTAMLIGGVSSSGFSSYSLITKEIQKALSVNGISYSRLRISLRVIWKIRELIFRIEK